MQAQRGANSSPNMGRWTGRVTQLTQGKQAARLESCLSYLRYANSLVSPVNSWRRTDNYTKMINRQVALIFSTLNIEK